MSEVHPPGPATIPKRILQFGYVATTVLVFLCLAAAAFMSYMVVERMTAQTARQHDVLLIRLTLSCIAIFVGLAFGCLGFGLFLIQAEGTLTAHGDDPSTARTSIQVTAPGLAVIVCATCIIYFGLRGSISAGSHDTAQPASAAGQGMGWPDGAPAPGTAPKPNPNAEPRGGQPR